MTEEGRMPDDARDATADEGEEPPSTVMPEGAEANDELGARTAGTPDRRHGGAGGGAGPGSDAPLGGQQV